MENKEFTQIQVEKKVRDHLARIGRKEETFNDIIKRISKFEE